MGREGGWICYFLGDAKACLLCDMWDVIIMTRSNFMAQIGRAGVIGGRISGRIENLSTPRI